MLHIRDEVSGDSNEAYDVRMSKYENLKISV